MIPDASSIGMDILKVHSPFVSRFQILANEDHRLQDGDKHLVVSIVKREVDSVLLKLSCGDWLRIRLQFSLLDIDSRETFMIRRLAVRETNDFRRFFPATRGSPKSQ